MKARVRIWDLPVRLVHWSLVLLVPFSWWSATYDHLPWHRLSGYTILGLLVFRLIWGVVGSQTARFASFVRGPAAIVAYVRGRGGAYLGHTPLGGLSVLALLASLILQVSLGLFSVDQDGFEAGPLSHFVSFEQGRAIASLHELNFYGLLGLIALHLGAIAFYRLRRRDLIGPMLTGKGPLPDGLGAPRPGRAVAAVLAAAAAIAIAVFLARGLRLPW